MRDTLNLVRGAVSDRDLMPVLTHFHIYDGRVQGTNGRVTIDAPCAALTGLNITVPADAFLRAVDACGGEPDTTITPGGKLRVARGSFRALLPLLDNTAFPLVPQPPVEGAADVCVVDDQFLPTLALLREFVADDASRPWACSIMFKNGAAYATNNVNIARRRLSAAADMTIPTHAVDELLRVGSCPAFVVVCDAATTFLFDGWWMRSVNINGEWPNVERFFEGASTKILAMNAAPLRAAVERILPFCPDKKIPTIILTPGTVSTSDGSMSAEVTVADVLEFSAKYRAEPLLLALRSANGIDLSAYPAPCYWRGDKLDGVIVGVT